MSIKSRLKFSLIIIFSVLLVGVGIVYLHFQNEEKETVEKVDAFMTEKNYEENIKEKEVLYDWKLGTHYVKVTFEDEPENFYEFYPDSSKSGVNIIGYNDGVEITDKDKGKYIDDNK